MRDPISVVTYFVEWVGWVRQKQTTHVGLELCGSLIWQDILLKKENRNPCFILIALDVKIGHYAYS